jgi:hypothetical protein
MAFSVERHEDICVLDDPDCMYHTTVMYRTAHTYASCSPMFGTPTASCLFATTITMLRKGSCIQFEHKHMDEVDNTGMHCACSNC